ncbi:bifunctional methylenetetrahydrofolate dehydrogenase/methenyltetrahydrofolate cyclohydrolase [bacterium]|nr:bifunctional methylenetetrahydrofolate dehydrogenase/methenyltetrahydrofolate cyclohydrolase [bacterium]
MKILDGRSLSKQILDDLKSKIDSYNQNTIPPKLVMVMVGDNPASISYIKQKQKSAAKVGLLTEVLNLSQDLSTAQIVNEVEKLNYDNTVHGILVQLPLPVENPEKIIDAIDPDKDVDGFHPFNVGHVFTNKDLEEMAPCTPKGVIKMLEHYQIPIKGKHVTVVGHSNIVGKPLAVMLLNRDATITVCNVYTSDLKAETLKADILISATGVPNLIKKDMVKDQAVIIDVGFYKDENGIKGDIDFENVKDKVSYISKVPGGAGPMTVACLIENTIIAYEKQISN